MGGIYGLTVDSANFDPLKEDKNWTVNGLLNQTLGITEFYFTDFSPQDPNVMLGGAQDNSTPALSGATLSYGQNVGGGDGGGAAINPNDKANQYSSPQYYGFYILYEKICGLPVWVYDVHPYYYGLLVVQLRKTCRFAGQILHDPNRNAIYVRQ